ncbi:MAG: NAD-dependent epimerase/dehydratase family protein [Hyphomicrobiaceae bacterium]
MTATTPIVPRKVLVTGGTGLVGKQLLNAYRARGIEAVGVARRPDEALGVVAGDVSNPSPWAHHLDGCDIVFHAAAVVSLVEKREVAWTVNVKGTQLLLDEAAKRGVKRFEYVSSVAAMGFESDDGADETWPLMPNGNTYTDSKIAAEHAVLAAHASGKINVTIIRPADVYGVESAWIREPLNMMRARQFMLPNEGNGHFSPIHVNDLVDGMMLSAESPRGAGQIFILADGGVTTREFFSYHWRWLGREGSPPALPARALKALATAGGGLARAIGAKTEMGPGAIAILCRPGGYSSKKAETMLGFAPKIALADGMAEVEAELRRRGELGTG